MSDRRRRKSHYRANAARFRLGSHANRENLIRALGFECLEARMLLAADFGDAPAPYPTLLAANGASHEAVGPTLGALRDTESDGAPSAAADADGADEDGVTFGLIRVGQLGATVTVKVQNAPIGAKLDAWIDFDADGNWGSALEQIAKSVAVVEGDNIINFDVPSHAASGVSFARFRLSTAGGLGPKGAALDGEVEDYPVLIDAPLDSSGVFGDQRIVTTSAIEAKSVYAADLDNDGDMDIVGGYSNVPSGTHKVAWYENDGNEVFIAHDINGFNQTAYQVQSVSAADIDGDGDLDVLSTAPTNMTGDYFIGWYENDGTPAAGSWTPHYISTASNAFSMQAGDVDGDGDLDVVSAFTYSNHVSWWENDGTPGDGVWTYHVIATTGANGAHSVHASDLDRDGDLDLLVAATGASRIIWYINNGTGGFSSRVISTTTLGATDVFTADLDRDGDFDIISASQADDKIAWFKNDGTPTMGAWPTYTISTTADLAQSVFAADMDGDGDMDVVSASENDDKIAWYENDGTPDVGAWTTRIISTGANFAQEVHVADVDGDGDLDVLSASDFDNKIAWYENKPTSVGIAAPPASVSEESASSLAYTFTRRGQGIGSPLTVNFDVGGPADYGVDYTVSGAASFDASGGSIHFPAGVDQVAVTITPLDDALVELDESIVLTLTPDAAFVFDGAPIGIGTITSAEYGGDFGDAPAPFPTTTAESGAGHSGDSLTSPRLAAARDTESDGVHSALADADGPDEDGVTFANIRIGQHDESVIVNIQNLSITHNFAISPVELSRLNSGDAATCGW